MPIGYKLPMVRRSNAIESLLSVGSFNWCELITVKKIKHNIAIEINFNMSRRRLV